MHCPECDDATMQRRGTSDGVEVDACPSCGAAWLDRGEIFFFVHDRRRFADAIDDARKGDPGEPWLEGSFGDDLPFLLETRSGGVFLPAATVEELVRRGDLALKWRESQVGQLVVFGAPNLALRALLAFVLLYALLAGVAYLAVKQAEVDLWLGVPTSLGLLALSFLAGPWFLDVSLQWFNSARRCELADLPTHLAAFIQRTCAAHGMRPPRILVIADGTPEAFTYGQTPSTARLVISDGLISLLEPQELEAVVGHELGHAKHWDILLMTAAQAVLEALAIVRIKVERDADDGSRIARARESLARIILVVEELAQYVVLWLSRTREYHADRFGAEAVGSAAAMARALVKVAYGLAAERNDRRGPDRQALGIFDRRAAATLALVTRGSPGMSRHGIDQSALLGAMKWDLWNPWAMIAEVHSTHPLVAKRLLHLSAVSERLGEPPWLRFDLPRPESYWDEFAVDLAVLALPVGACVVAWQLMQSHGTFGLGLGLALVGLTWALQLRFRYPTHSFPEMSVATLMRRVKVSGVRPIPCRVEGVVIGRGEPGLVWSDDFVLRDATGLIFVDHRQPLRIAEVVWGFFFGSHVLQGNAILEGWFRRSPVPYIEVRRFWIEGRVRRSWFSTFLRLVALGLVIGGATLAWLHR